MMQLTPAQKKAIAAAVVAASAVAVPYEGIKLTPYYDPPGILSVCAGHTGADVVKNKTYTMAQCRQFLDADMLEAVTRVEQCAPGAPQGVLVAFGDAVYNIGPKIACDTLHSTAARMLKAGDWAAACRQLPRWDHTTMAGVSVALPGLTKRRATEQEICLKGLT
jgi:GH24 family phage-related lysozyme (muramidase)